MHCNALGASTASGHLHAHANLKLSNASPHSILKIECNLIAAIACNIESNVIDEERKPSPRMDTEHTVTDSAHNQEECIDGKTAACQDCSVGLDRLRDHTLHGEPSVEGKGLQDQPQDDRREQHVQPSIPHQIEPDHLEGLDQVEQRSCRIPSLGHRNFGIVRLQPCGSIS